MTSVGFSGSTRIVISLLLAVAVSVVLAPAAKSSALRRHATTDGGLALANLDAQVAGAERLVEAQPPNVESLVQLAELLVLRGRVKGSVRDFERADAVAADALTRFAGSREALLLGAKVDALFHRFPRALESIDAAEAGGAGASKCAAMRASIYQALARYDEARVIREAQYRVVQNVATTAALAGLHAELGELDLAARLYAEARRQVRDVSPLPIASMWFDEGLMWMQAGQWLRAQECFQHAVEILPGFVPAQGHLAEVEAQLGQIAEAVERLQPLAGRSDDPDYAGQLARITGDDQLFGDAARRYTELVTHHPEAYADHAAELWLAHGDYAKALPLARANLQIRRTARAFELTIRAAVHASPSEVSDLCRDAASVIRYAPTLATLCPA